MPALPLEAAHPTLETARPELRLVERTRLETIADPRDMRAAAVTATAPDMPRRPRAASPKPAEPAPGPQEAAALAQAETEADRLKAEEILAAMEIQRRRTQERIAALWAELETECLRIWQEVMIHRQRVMDDLFEKWTKLLTG